MRTEAKRERIVREEGAARRLREKTVGAVPLVLWRFAMGDSLPRPTGWTDPLAQQALRRPRS